MSKRSTPRSQSSAPRPAPKAPADPKPLPLVHHGKITPKQAAKSVVLYGDNAKTGKAW